MTLKMTAIGLLALSLSGFAVAAPAPIVEWVNIDTSETKDKDGKLRSKFTYDLQKDDFSQYSFDTPFVLTGRNEHKYLVPDMTAFDYSAVSKTVVDCKNLRYAVQYLRSSDKKITGVDKNKQFVTKPNVEIETYFKAGAPVPSQFWTSFSKQSPMYKDICPQTKGFDQNFVPVKDQISGWKFVDLKTQHIYINEADLSNYDLHKPFKLRHKRFDVKFAPNEKPSTAVIDEIMVNCKNQKYVHLKSTYLGNDYEYKPNPKPVIVDTVKHIKNANSIPASKWNPLNMESIKPLNICL